MMYNENYCEPIMGNSLDLDIDECNCEIRADVVVEKTTPSVRLWGQIKDCDGYPIPNALIKLVKVIECHGTYKYEGIAHTMSDCYGFYQFDICANNCKNYSYRVIVGKSIGGSEKVITSGGNCDVCEDNCNPCDNGNSYDSCHSCNHCNSQDNYNDCNSCYPIPPKHKKNIQNYDCMDEHDCKYNKTFIPYYRSSEEMEGTEECYTLDSNCLLYKNKKQSRLAGYFKNS